MAAFIDTCIIWVVGYRLDGRDRQWVRALPPSAEAPVRTMLLEELDELYGARAELVWLRRATDEERQTFLAGGQPFCPVTAPVASPTPPAPAA
ncbi:hypothetical protein [Roseateles chitosanitabidus]|jgi:hypothetical protein|uniref:hypothetical protein n=1 Tax=Roseateles chitosanitabidus TaxID=65048 RepID=UPI000836E737|nr:hypothetical protein [Roseateles chitosanitabidus]MBO9688331.1 hypothetical protein [Roseateles chitosanitabidus]